MSKIHIMFSKDLDETMVVYVGDDCVRFNIDGKKVELDKWKVEALIQILVDYDKGVK